MAESDICAVCGGSREEHANSRHVFTTTPGDLRAPDQKKQPPGMPMVIPNPKLPDGFQRLVEVMLEKQYMTQEEALYIMGVGPKPESGKLKFRDPADG